MPKNTSKKYSPKPEFELFDIEVGTPHAKAFLTTRFGRLVDNASYLFLFIFVLGILTVSTIYFTSPPSGHGISDSKGKVESLSAAAYFSVVTFTSLGYGDLSPQGFGRIVAAVVVLCGLVLVALLVGKVASERQYSMLLLLHTSDCQRRLKGFCIDLQEAVKAIDLACKNSNPSDLRESTKQMMWRIEAIGRYVIFNSHQAHLAAFGNDSALRALYEEMQRAQQACSRAFKSPSADQVVCTRSIALTNRLAAIVKLLVVFQRKSKSPTWLKANISDIVELAETCYLIRNPAKNILKDEGAEMIAVMHEGIASLDIWAKSNMSPWLLSQVAETLPTTPIDQWPADNHKTVAHDLGISNTLARNCIDTLIKANQVPQKVKESPESRKYSQFRKNLYYLLRFLNKSTTSIQKIQQAGRPLSQVLDKLQESIERAKREAPNFGAELQWRESVNKGDSKRILRQLLRTQNLMITILESPMSDTTEKHRAMMLSIEILKLAEIFFDLSHGIQSSSPNFIFLKLFYAETYNKTRMDQITMLTMRENLRQRKIY